jgi:hypothetical protein
VLAAGRLRQDHVFQAEPLEDAAKRLQVTPVHFFQTLGIAAKGVGVHEAELPRAEQTGVGSRLVPEDRTDLEEDRR